MFKLFKNNREKSLTVISVFLLIIVLFLFFHDCINEILNFILLDFDGSYNAQVAKNFAEEGFYGVNYPDRIAYYNIITTGPTVLLPTALIYKMFGINYLTTGIIPLIYAAGVITLLFLLSLVIFKRMKTVCGVGVILLYLGTSSHFQYTSTHLIGETAALFFTLLSVCLLIRFLQKRNYMVLFFSGYFLSFSFVTKTSQICICLVMIMLLLVDTIFKRFGIKDYFMFLCSFICGLLSWDIFKLVQFKGDLKRVFDWWILEKQNMFNQTGTRQLFSDFSLELILDRLYYLREVFYLPVFIYVLLMLFPLLIYAGLLMKNWNKKSFIDKYIVLSYLGIAGDSLLVYFIFFGSSGMKYARRLSVYADCILIFNIFFIIIIFNEVISKKGIFSRTLFCILIIGGISVTFIRHYATYFLKRGLSNEYLAQSEMLEELNKLDPGIDLYVYGWWQAPELSLYSDKEFRDISNYPATGRQVNPDKSYILVSSRMEIGEDNKVLFSEYMQQFYELDLVWHSSYSENSELFCIYKIKRNKY